MIRAVIIRIVLPERRELSLRMLVSCLLTELLQIVTAVLFLK